MTAPRAPIEIHEFPEPDLPAGGALLRTGLSEVCGTDVHLWHGRLSGVPYPIIPGHVSTGTLERVRGSIADIRGGALREGDRVAFFDVHRTCGRCLACTVHRTPTRCPSRRVYGITDPASEGLFGGWSQKIYLEPGVAIARLPDPVSFESYIGGGCGLLTAVHIVERARHALGDTVVVQGAGSVGLSTAALIRHHLKPSPVAGIPYRRTGDSAVPRRRCVCRRKTACCSLALSASLRGCGSYRCRSPTITSPFCHCSVCLQRTH
jgi:L-iditol 2-dehydrogenase